jgi:hypothetical protein
VIHRLILTPQPGGHARTAVERRARVLLINQPHHQEILFALGRRFVVEARPRQAQQIALAADAELRVSRFDQLPFTL